MAVYAEYCRRMNAVVGWEGIKPPAWEGLAESSRNDYRMTVDAVLKELRNPTDAMVKAGNVTVYSDDMACGINALRCDGDGETSTECWQAMSDEAMK